VEMTGGGWNVSATCPPGFSVVGKAPPASLHSNSITLVLLPPLFDFEDSDDDSKGSQEPDKELTFPEVMALSNSPD
jgi:hypothetical protein